MTIIMYYQTIVFLTFFTLLHTVQSAAISANIKDGLNSSKTENNSTENNGNGTVTIYTWSNFRGIPWGLTIENCTDVPAFFYKKTSSIDTHDNCMMLYGRQKCQGRHVIIAPGTNGHSHLSVVDFDDTLASLKPCDEDDADLDLHKIQDEPIEGKNSAEGKHQINRREVDDDEGLSLPTLLALLGQNEGITESYNNEEDQSQDEDSGSDDDGNDDGQGTDDYTSNSGGEPNMLQSLVPSSSANFQTGSL